MQESTYFPPAMPPGIDEVKIYFSQRGISITEAEQFFTFYNQAGWKNRRGSILKNWKNTAYQWILKILKAEPWRFNKEVH